MLALVLVGCGSDDSSTTETLDSPAAVAAAFIDGVVDADPQACSLLTDGGVALVETVTQARTCEAGIQDRGALRSLLGPGDSERIQAATVSAAPTGDSDEKQGLVFDKGGGCRFRITLVNEGGEWRVESVGAEGTLPIGSEKTCL